MAFPVSPTNGQTAVVNNITYQFSNVGNTWTRLVSTANVITANTIVSNGIISAVGNVSGNYILGNGSQLTGISINPSNISSGTSNVTIVSAGGNATVNIGGTSNVAVFATTGEYITGVLSASGNVTGGNILTAGAISATGTLSVTGATTLGTASTGNLSSGNISTGGLVSATANVVGGNILTGGVISAASTITGTSHLGAVVSVTANVTGGNLLTGGLISSTGNITGGNLLTAGLISSTGTITGTSHLGAVVSVTANVTGGNLLTGGQISATGTVTSNGATNSTAFAVGNSAVSNVALGMFPTAGTSGEYAIRDYSNVFSHMYLDVGMGGTANGAFRFRTTNAFTTLANINSTGITTPLAVSATGNITGNYFIGNGSQLTGVTATTTSIVNGTSNVVVAASGNVTVGVAGTATVATFTTAGIVSNSVATTNNGAGTNFKVGDDVWLGDVNTADTMSIRGQQNAANGYVVFGNADATTKLGRAGSGPLTYDAAFSAAGNVTGGNLLTGGLISATGNVSGNNINLSGNIVDTGALSIITGSNGNLALAPNGTGIVTVSSALSATGNVTGGNLLTAGLISATGNVTGNYIFGNGSQLTGISAATSGFPVSAGNSNIAASPNANIAISISGTANVAVFDTTGEYITGLLSASGNVTGGNIISLGTLSTVGRPTFGAITLPNTDGTASQLLATYGNGSLYFANVSAGNVLSQTFTGNGVQTIFTLSSAPPSINSTFVSYNGVLLLRSSYTLSGANITFTSAPANASSIEVTTVNPGSGGLSGTPTAAGTDTQVQFNDGGIFGASANLTFNKTSGVFTAKNLASGGSINETVYTITDGAAVDLDPVNGTVQLWTLGASRTPTANNFSAGQSMTLMVTANVYSITWSSVAVTWVGNSAPTLASTGQTVIQLWKVSSTVYGALVGTV